MFSFFKKGYFNKYSEIVDEGIHIVISILIASTGFLFDLSYQSVAIIFILGLLIDIDHIFNPSIAKIMHLTKKMHIEHGVKGITIKIFHGFDMAIVWGYIAYLLTGEISFGVILAINLSAHELWDFLVYPHKATELLLISRAAKHFKPGKRKYWVGTIFNKRSLEY